MQHLLAKVGSWFYKDSHLVIQKKSGSLPDGGLKRDLTVNMLTLQPATTKTAVLSNAGDKVDLTGTYGLSPWDIFNPFKQNTNIIWLMMYQQGLLKDVTAEIIHPRLGSFAVTVNNPQVGTPYAVFYNSPIEMVIPSMFVGKRFDLSEGKSATWTSEGGIVVEVKRLNDSDCKEFVVTL